MIAYASKRLPEAAKKYSIAEVEMCGLAINIVSFAHLLKRVDLDAIVDHLALVHILKSKTEPATTRIKRLLEVLSMCSFNLYYMKGKDMILSDFLPRQRVNRSNPQEIIPISFDMKAILKEKYYSLVNESKYLVQTHSHVKDKGIKLPEVHGVDKGVDPDIKLEWIVRMSQKLTEKSKLNREDSRREIDSQVQAQPQAQLNRENYVKEQMVSKQKESIMYLKPNRTLKNVWYKRKIQHLDMLIYLE